jgi:hypothetical protein
MHDAAGGGVGPGVRGWKRLKEINWKIKISDIKFVKFLI